MAELDLTKLISHFAHSNQAEGKSPKTVSWYSDMLFDYVKFLRAIGIPALLGELNPVVVREFIIREQNRGMSPYTIQCRVRTLKVFSSWLLAEGYTDDNLLKRVKLPKAPKKIIEPLTQDEIDRLIAAQNPLTAMGSRNIAVLVTLLDTGLRVSELCDLRFEDAHIDKRYLKVMGKGSKERVVPLGALAQKAIWRYVFHFRPEPEGKLNDYLFLSVSGKHMLSNAIELLFKRWGRSAGVPRIHAHLCRHTYATNFLTQKCGDVFRLKMILGHSTLEMVNKYVHFASVQDMIYGRVSSPVDQIGIKKLRGYKIDRALRGINR